MEHEVSPNTPPRDPFIQDMKYAEEKIAEARRVLDSATPVYEELKRAYAELPALRVKELKKALGISESEKIWSYTLGTDSTIISPVEAKKWLEASNIYISDLGKDLLSKTHFSKESKTYDLIELTIEQLGFPNGATTTEIDQRRQGLDLYLCPAEVGPHLRLSYPGRDVKIIAMEPIFDRNGTPRTFYLDDTGFNLELNVLDASPQKSWIENARFVFLLIKLDA